MRSAHPLSSLLSSSSSSEFSQLNWTSSFLLKLKLESLSFITLQQRLSLLPPSRVIFLGKLVSTKKIDFPGNKHSRISDATRFTLIRWWSPLYAALCVPRGRNQWIAASDFFHASPILVRNSSFFFLWFFFFCLICALSEFNFLFLIFFYLVVNVVTWISGRRSSLCLKLCLVTIHLIYAGVLFLFDGDLIERTKKEPWRVFLTFIISSVTLNKAAFSALCNVYYTIMHVMYVQVSASKQFWIIAIIFLIFYFFRLLLCQVHCFILAAVRCYFDTILCYLSFFSRVINHLLTCDEINTECDEGPRYFCLCIYLMWFIFCCWFFLFAAMYLKPCWLLTREVQRTERHQKHRSRQSYFSCINFVIRKMDLITCEVTLCFWPQSALSRNGSYVISTEGNLIARNGSGSYSSSWSKLVADLYPFSIR